MLAAVSPSVSDMLRHSGAGEAALRGQVQLVRVAAIRDTVGARWPRHQPLVEDFVTRAFARNASEDDMVVRVNDTDFLLIQPSRSPMGALSRSSVLLRETLTFFLGAAEAENIRISVVDRIGDEGLEATRVTGDQLEAAARERTGDLARSRDGSAPWERFGVARPARKTVAIKRPGQAEIQAIFYLDPVWHVTREAVVSFVVRTVAVQRMADGAIEPVDRRWLTAGAAAALTIERLMFVEELLGDRDRPEPAIVVHVPISLNALSYSGARTAVLGELRRLVESDRRDRLMIELMHVPEGLPESRLSEAVAQTRPYARGVLVRAETLSTDVSNWLRSGAVGVIHNAATPGQPEKATLAALPGAVDRARQAGLSPSLYGVQSGSVALAAWSAGVSHMSGDHITGRLGPDPVAQRFSVMDLYRK